MKELNSMKESFYYNRLEAMVDELQQTLSGLRKGGLIKDESVVVQIELPYEPMRIFKSNVIGDCSLNVEISTRDLSERSDKRKEAKQ